MPWSPFGGIAPRADAALLPYETPWVDLSARTLEEDEFGPVVAIVGIIAVVAVVAMVTDSHLDSSVHMGPFNWDLNVN